MRVLELWRYPVKSLGGERLEHVEVGEAGIVGDRGWGIQHIETGNVLTARRAPELLFAAARIVADDVVITLPDGVEVSSADAGVDATLSTWLDREVHLTRPGDEGATYENPMDVENEADWISWKGPTWSFHDSTKSMVSIVGADTLGDRDIRRFRTNVVVSGGEEDALVGSAVLLGSAMLDVTKHIDRCIMVTRPQPGLDRDLDVLKRVIKERNNFLSVGALVTQGGSVAVGDEFAAA